MEHSAMAALAHSVQAKRRLRTSMDALPVEVIGRILSCLGYAHYIARASATCRKWREAAKHHLYKLAFEEFNHRADCQGGRTSADWEITITETLMRTSCLEELEIRLQPGSRYRFYATLVIAWLLHTKKTLKSLILMQPIRPSVNILEKLGGRDSKLEKLELGFGCITTIDPSIHRFDSLVSLTFFCMESALAASNLRAILSVCPRLESLVLVDTHISWDGYMQPYPTMEITSASLKSLFINGGFDAIKCLILHTKGLERLWLKEVNFQLLKLVQEDGHGSLRRLSIQHASIAQLDIGETANLLLKLRLSGLKDFEAEWAKFYRLFARARKLKKLYLSDCIPDGYKFDIGLNKIALSFPCLSVLELNYEHACNAFVSSGSSLELPTFASVTVLKLCTPKFNKQFTRWIICFLRQCPRLKRLVISGGFASGKRKTVNERMAEFTLHMIKVMRSYPGVDIEFFFL